MGTIRYNPVKDVSEDGTMLDITLQEIEQATEEIHSVMLPTPQLNWPIISHYAGCETWVKHENHTPVGAFKVRGGLVYLSNLKRNHPDIEGVVTATRGNHGQSIGYAAKRLGLKATIVVPYGNSFEKNAAMRALGVNVVEQGIDFQGAVEHAQFLSEERGLHRIRSFERDLVLGVSTYSYELFNAVADLDTVYVPIGMGSGICGMIAARDAMNLKTKIVGVVTQGAPAYALSFAKGVPVSTEQAQTIADGLACRIPDPQALAMILKGAERVVTVSDEAILTAIRLFFTATHNVAEGAGAAALAALLQDRGRYKGKKVGIVLSGGNIDIPLFQRALQAKPLR